MTDDVNDSNKEEDLTDYESPRGIVRRWNKEESIAYEDKDEQTFREQGREIVRKYKNYSGESLGRANKWFGKGKLNYNILWSNIQTLKPTLYARLPKVIAERRFHDRDDLGRVASNILERATGFSLAIESDNFNESIDRAVEDRLLPGRGTCWAEFHADFDQVNDAGADGNLTETVRALSEKQTTKYLFWEDYLNSPDRQWDEVRWVRKRAFLTRDQGCALFGDIFYDVRQNEKADKQRNEGNEPDTDFFKRFEVREFWNKEDKKVYWIAPGLPEKPLKIEDNPLQLVDFFPCPRPLYATITNDSLVPTADYRIYAALADELDIVTRRLKKLTEVVRVVGVGPASEHDIFKKMMALDDGQVAPHPMFMALMEKGGVKSLVDWFPFEKVVEAISNLTQRQVVLQQQIYEITGMPDIIRGQSDPRETASAQQTKSHFATIRIAKKQADVQRFVRELVVRKAEIIFSHFSDQTIAMMSGLVTMDPDDQQYFGQALSMLRDDKFRTFRIDIETDSTIAIDEEQEKASMIEAISAIGNSWNQAGGLIQMFPDLMDPLLELNEQLVRRFRSARSAESAFYKTRENLQQQREAQAQQPPQPSPEEIQMQQKMALNEQAQQHKMQMEEVKTQSVQQKAQMDAQIKQIMAQNQMAIDNMKANHAAMLEAYKVKSEAGLAAEKVRADIMIEAAKATMSNQSKQVEALHSASTSQKMAEVHIHTGGKKQVTLVNPRTGETKVGVVEDVPNNVQ